MTNAELLAKIKAEIERLKDENSKIKCQANERYCSGYDDAFYDLIPFIDTLESEKPINPEAAMKELDEKIALVKQRGTWDGVDVDKYMDEVRGREPENPMSLEEEINRYLHEECSSDDEPGIHEIAEHFAEWGYLRAAEKYNEIEYNRQRAEENASNDLEEAAKEYAEGIIQREDALMCKQAFIAGAEWQKEQMMKEQADLFTIVALDAAQRAREQMMKDIPKWHKVQRGSCFDKHTNFLLSAREGHFYCSSIEVPRDGYILLVDELERLPKEDEK